jgi:uncharacterized membrane protein YeaQ/YmgE (transglycosylase-associated protein family)
MPLEDLMIIIIVGAIAGLGAKALVRGVRIGLILTVLIGIVGAFLGDWLFNQMNITIAVDPLLAHIITAFVGAVILLIVLRSLSRA